MKNESRSIQTCVFPTSGTQTDVSAVHGWKALVLTLLKEPKCTFRHSLIFFFLFIFLFSTHALGFMAVTKGSTKARNHCSTNLHPRQASSSTKRAFREGLMPGESEDHMQVSMPYFGSNLSTSSINQSSTIIDIVKEDQLSSTVSCPHPLEVYQPVSSKKEYKQ